MKRFASQSVISQLAQSAASVMAVIALAHSLGEYEFGIAAGGLLASSLLMSMFRTLFGEQVIAQGLDHGENQSFGSFIALAGPLLTLSAFAAGIASGTLAVALALAYCGATVFADLVRYRRMALLSNSGSRGLLCVEVVRLVVSLAAVVMSTRLGMGTVPSAILLGGALMWPLIDVRVLIPSPRRALLFLRARDAFDHAILAQFLFGTATLQTLPIVAAVLYGSSDFGALRLTQSLIAPAVVVASAFTPSLIHHLAGLAAHDRRRSLRRLMLLCGAIATTVYLALIASRPFWVKLAAPDDLAATVGALVPALAAPACLALLGLPGSAMIRVGRLGRPSLVGQLTGVLASIVGVAIVALTGASIEWFVLALALGSLATLFSTYVLLFRNIRRTESAMSASPGRQED